MEAASCLPLRQCQGLAQLIQPGIRREGRDKFLSLVFVKFTAPFKCQNGAQRSL
jgi:hypothetical protein